MTTQPDHIPKAGWILYDHSCGFCRRWIPFWENALVKRGFGIATLQEDWVRERIGLPEQTLMQDLRLLFPDGSHLAGAEVYRFAMRRIWWAMPFYALSIVPGCRQLFDAFYRCFAKNRYRVSSACKLR